MMFNLKTYAAITIAALGLTYMPAATAHHSYASHYDFDAELAEVEGTVTQWWFVNPHVRIIMDVVEDDGKTHKYTLEGRARSHMMREGWTGGEIKKGYSVKVIGIPSSRGEKFARHMLMETIFVNGVEVNAKPLGEDVQRSFNDENYQSKALTDAQAHIKSEAHIKAMEHLNSAEHIQAENALKAAAK